MVGGVQQVVRPLRSTATMTEKACIWALREGRYCVLAVLKGSNWELAVNVNVGSSK